VGSRHQAAFRLLSINRGVAGAVLITIALGVGGTAAVFSVVYGVLLRPLALFGARGLVRMWEVHPGGQAPSQSRTERPDLSRMVAGRLQPCRTSPHFAAAITP
jgi:hypothetical protein